MPINTPTGYLDITNATLRGSKIVTTGFVGIANANPTNHLSIGSNLHINDTHSNVLQISGNINAASVVLGGISIAPTFDLEVVTNTGNTTPYTVEFNNAATAFVTTANATIGDTLTASKLVGDGSGISAIQSSNVTDFASNVSRITTLETSRALKSDLNNNSSRITNLSSNLSDNSARITNLSSNLSDNSSRITTLESGDFSISGEKTFTGQVIFESNIHMAGGNVLVANTINMTVSDPIIELGSNNLNTGDLGIVMTRHNNNSNIAFVYDESDDILRMGYTLNGASSSVIYLDSNALAVGVQGTMTADKIVASNVIPATSTTTGALTVAGGVGVGGNVHCTNLYANNITMNLVSFSGLQTFEQVVNNGHILNSNVLIISNATPSTSSATGALTLTAGGLGVEGNVHIGSNLFVTGETTLSNLSVTGDATVSNLSVTGETVEVANLAVTSGSLELTQVANVFQVKSSSNVVTEYVRSKKLIKYPRVAMTAATTVGYTASASGNFGSYYPWEVFDNNNPVGGNTGAGAGWASPIDASNKHYNPATGAFNLTTQHHTGSLQGEWIQIQIPEPIYLHDFVLESRSETSYGADGYDHGYPKTCELYASTDGSTWTSIRGFTTGQKTSSQQHIEQVNAVVAYKYYALVINSIQIVNNTTQVHWTSVGQIELHGIPEYDPDAHGTDVIARSIPNVPNTDWLEVYWDAKNYSGSGDVQDETSNNRDGTVNCGFDNGDVKAFTFSGAYTSNVTTSDHGLGTGDVTYTVSYWFKRTAVASSYDYLFLMGPGGLNRQNILMYIHVDELRLDHWGAQLTVPEPITLNKWYHVVAGHRGGNTPDLNNDFIYIDGKKINVTASGSGAAFNLASGKLTLGSSHYTTTEFFNGSIANFRVFNRALTGDEVWQLYAYQKEYFDVSPDVVTFKGGRLGIGTSEPRAVLDVQGDIHGGCPVYFQALYNANFSATAYNNGSGGALIPWNKLFEHKGSCFDTSTGLFTAPIDGVYRFGYSVRKQTASYSTCWTYIQKNGAPMNGINNSPGRVYVEGSATVFVSQTFILDLSAGDTIGILLAESDASGTDARISNSYNYFHGYYIGTGNGSFGSYSY